MSETGRDAGPPDPNERPCSDCGHVWFQGERPHEYAEEPGEHPDDVAVVCRLCRHQRAFKRGEP